MNDPKLLTDMLPLVCNVPEGEAPYTAAPFPEGELADRNEAGMRQHAELRAALGQGGVNSYVGCGYALPADVAFRIDASGIFYNREACKRYGPATLAAMIVHEICHALEGAR